MRRPGNSAKAALLIVVIAVVAYLPALPNGFIWDDDAWLWNYQAGRGLSGLRDVWFDLRALQQYYPLTGTVFWLEYQLWGSGPFGYHVVNILLHAANAVLFGFVLQKLGLRGGWFAAAIFAVHPVMVESVAWITEIKNVLSTTFYLSSALAYLNFDDLETAKRERNWKWFGLSLLLYFCALLTKSVTCSLPVALAILIWWKRPRLRLADVWPLLPFFLIGVPMGLLTAWIESHYLGALGPEWSLRFDERCIVAGHAVLFYFYKLIWPAKLTFIYPRWQFISPWLLLFPAVVVISVIALWFGRHRIGKAPLAATACFIVTLSPVLGFMNAYAQQFSFVADHWQYLGSLGVISLASAVPQLLPFRTRSLRAICLVLPIVALGALTWRQCPIYRNVETLWRDTLSKNWNCWIAQNNLGFVLKETGRFAEAEQHFRAAIEMKPRYGEAENNLGEALLAQDKVDEAGAHIDNSLRINPHYVAANWDKALVSLRQGKRDEAYAIVSEGLHQRSIYLPGLNNFAWLLATSRDPKVRDPHRAEELARRCSEVSGYTSPRYLDTLAAAYAAQSQFEEAQKIAREAVSLALKSNRTNTAARIRQRLELYQSGQSYIER